MLSIHSDSYCHAYPEKSLGNGDGQMPSPAGLLHSALAEVLYLHAVL